MAHVTFIHGIANKPKADDLLGLWERALADGDDEAVALRTEGVQTNLVYWADVLYREPDPDLAAHEGLAEETAEQVDGGGDAELPKPVSEESLRFIDAMRARLTSLPDEAIDHDPLPTAAATGLERVPLPWFVKKRIMAALLRDVHHYLFNVVWTPRPGVRFAVQDEIRRRFLAGLEAAGGARPHVVVSHSMGTVIAYDCLKRVPGCPKIDALVTLGSPLGLDEIQDTLAPEWSRNEGFPTGAIRSEWVNGFDRLDVVCGADPVLANDYRWNAAAVIKDVDVSNPGAWKHSATKYYRQPAVRRELRRLLEL